MSMMVSFVLSFFPRDVLDEILNLIESVSEDFPSYSYQRKNLVIKMMNVGGRAGVNNSFPEHNRNHLKYFNDAW